MPQDNQQRVRRALTACPLYFILDESLCEIASPVEVGRAALSGGVRVMQLRLKQAEDVDLLDVADQLLPLCTEADCLLIINDNLKVALASGADGVHLGADDAAIADARRAAPELIIGATSRTAEDALAAQGQGADYLGCGSVYRSSTKPGLPILGCDGLAEIVSQVDLPVVGIGGINETNFASVLRAGAEGFCSIQPFAQVAGIADKLREFERLIKATMDLGGAKP